MANDPIEFSPPSECPIGQFSQEGSVKGGEMSIAFEGIVEKIIRVAIRLFHPVEEVQADRPRGFNSQNFPVLAISSSLAIRS